MSQPCLHDYGEAIHVLRKKGYPWPNITEWFNAQGVVASEAGLYDAYRRWQFCKPQGDRRLLPKGRGSNRNVPDVPRDNSKHAHYRKRNTKKGKCPHCGKPCEPYYECEERREYKRQIRRKV